MVILKHEDDIEWMKFVQNAAGAILGPMDAWLILRGTKTLPIRMERTNANSMAIAEHLAGHPKVERVHYVGLDSDPQHELAMRQLNDSGGMLAFEVAGGRDAGERVMDGLQLAARATSLGGVETTLEHRASVEPPVTKTPQNLLRVSVGLESYEDLRADLAQALEGRG